MVDAERICPVSAIRRFAVGRGSLLTMIAAGQGISLFVAENLGPMPSGIVAREIADEPESVAFFVVWSPYNQSAAVRNLLDLTRKAGRATSGSPDRRDMNAHCRLQTPAHRSLPREPWEKRKPVALSKLRKAATRIVDSERLRMIRTSLAEPAEEGE